jgi:hypothetical protein
MDLLRSNPKLLGTLFDLFMEFVKAKKFLLIKFTKTLAIGWLQSFLY